MVALLMLVLGAVQYTASAAMPSTRVAARGRMTNAVLGLLLLFGTYVLLNTINPELVMPGLGLSGTMGTEKLTIPASDVTLVNGVILYADEACETRIYQYRTSTPSLEQEEANNKAKSFKILDSGVIVNLYDEESYTGDFISVEGKKPNVSKEQIETKARCYTFEEFKPVLTEKVSSIKIFNYTELVLYDQDSPVMEEGKYGTFPTTPTHASEEKVTWYYNEKSVPLGNRPYFISKNIAHYTDKDSDILGRVLVGFDPDKAEYVDVPAGYYATLCYDTSGESTFETCYFFLESTKLHEYGDTRPAGPPLGPEIDSTNIGNDVSGLIILPSSEECKGVIFYTEPNYNEEPFLMTFREAAAFPIGLGEIKPYEDHEAKTDESYTRVKDLRINDLQFSDLGNPDVTSFKLIGNCKMKVCDNIDLGGSCDIFYKNEKDLINLCRPQSEICSCDIPNGAPNCPCACAACGCGGALIPLPSGGNCGPSKPEYDPVNDNCPVAICCPPANDWDNQIESFIICGANDETLWTPCAKVADGGEF